MKHTLRFPPLMPSAARAPWRPALALVGALALAGVAQAGTVQVSVTGQDGKPVPNAVVLVTPAAKAAPRTASPTPTLIEQRDLQFVPYVSVVQTGSTVRFTNRDPYDHHVRSVPAGPLGSIAPAKNFELRLAASEGKKVSSADVLLDKAGVVGLGCHLHGSMRGQLFITDTPYFARTDSKGIAVIESVPEGAADLALWHPDQLTEQPAQKVQVGSATLTLAPALNFSPKGSRRTAPPPDSVYK